MKKGRKVFVTYGNEKYYKSLQRIKKEAETTGRFDEIRIFTDKDLPAYITNHELFKFSRGGGYWLWKPWVVLETMKDMDDEDILVFSDSGSMIYDHKEWDKWFDIMNHKSSIFFFYSGLVEQWSRKNILDYFHNVKKFNEFYQLMSGLFLLRISSRYLIDEWYQLMFDHPELVIDVDKNEKSKESPRFIENRHDQAVLSGIVYSHLKDKKIKILYQNCEIQHPGGQAVFTARKSDTEQRNNTNTFPVHLEMIRKFYVVPMKYLKLYSLKLLNK